ncbi:hypothetical protein H8D36_05540, partial [archaeon]|nr:hypothetical protein [archaeon]
ESDRAESCDYEIAGVGSGDMSHSWLINNTCAGNFSFNVYDTTYNELNDTVNFSITGSSESQDTAASAAYKNSPAGSENIAFISTSNDVRSNISIVSNSQEYYLEMNWTNTFIPGTVIDSVIFWTEHYEDSDIPSVTLKWFNGATYENVNCGGISNVQTEANQSCDISSQIANYTLANDISLRLIFVKATGPAIWAHVDYTHINISFSGAAACTVWGNSAPKINEISILNPINLLAGRTKTVYCNASVTDSEEDMISANATFYYYLNGSSDPDNNNEHYTNSSCTFSGATIKSVSCAFQTLYYANNGTWYCNITTNDGNLTDNNFNMTIISPLYAVNITPTLLDYGDVPLGANSANMTINVTNLGNMPINVSVWGYGGTNSNSSGGDLSFMCNQEGNITIGYERYTTNMSQIFTDKTSLTSGPALLPMTISKQTQPATQIINNTYWETQIDTTNNPKGTCNGTIIFTAEAS